MRLASQNQEIGAKKKSRFMGPIPELGLKTGDDATPNFKAQDLFWAKFFYWLKLKVNNFWQLFVLEISKSQPIRSTFEKGPLHVKRGPPMIVSPFRK